MNGELQDHHVRAAARFHKLVLSGYSSKSLKLERVDGTPKNLFNHNMAGVHLAKLSAFSSQVLTKVIIHEQSLVQLGFDTGAKSRTTAYRHGLKALYSSLEEASAVLG